MIALLVMRNYRGMCVFFSSGVCRSGLFVALAVAASRLAKASGMSVFTSNIYFIVTIYPLILVYT